MQPLHTTVTLPALMDQRAVAAYLGKSIAWMERSRWDGTGIRYVKVGKAIRYRAIDVLDFVEQGLRTSTSQEVR